MVTECAQQIGSAFSPTARASGPFSFPRHRGFSPWQEADLQGGGRDQGAGQEAQQSRDQGAGRDHEPGGRAGDGAGVGGAGAAGPRLGKAAQPVAGEEGGVPVLAKIERVIIDPGKPTAAAARRLKIDTPRVFPPLLAPSRYKGAYGGRGSGKSHFFAELLVEDCLAERACWRSASARCRSPDAILQAADRGQDRALGGEARLRRFSTKEIQTPGDGVIISWACRITPRKSIKSLEGFQRAWIEEAQSCPTQPGLAAAHHPRRGSEIWASWNPRRKSRRD